MTEQDSYQFEDDLFQMRDEELFLIPPQKSR